MATAPAAHSRATACLEVATSGDSRSGPFSPAGRARRAAGPREGEDDSAAARSTAEAAGELVLLTAGFGFQLCSAPRRRLLVVALAAYLALRPALGTRRITLRTREPQLTEHWAGDLRSRITSPSVHFLATVIAWPPHVQHPNQPSLGPLDNRCSRPMRTLVPHVQGSHLLDCCY